MSSSSDMREVRDLAHEIAKSTKGFSADMRKRMFDLTSRLKSWSFDVEQVKVSAEISGDDPSFMTLLVDDQSEHGAKVKYLLDDTGGLAVLHNSTRS